MTSRPHRRTVRAPRSSRHPRCLACIPQEVGGISGWLVGLRNDGIGTGQATFRLVCAG